MSLVPRHVGTARFCAAAFNSAAATTTMTTIKSLERFTRSAPSHPEEMPLPATAIFLHQTAAEQSPDVQSPLKPCESIVRYAFEPLLFAAELTSETVNPTPLRSQARAPRMGDGPSQCSGPRYSSTHPTPAQPTARSRREYRAARRVFVGARAACLVPEPAEARRPA
jgi:hypothetical protein